MDNKYCPSCGIRLAVNPGDRAGEFKVITVRTSHQTDAGRKHFYDHKSLKLKALEWVIMGGDPPPAYKPATVVGRNAPMSKSPIVNLLTGRREFLLVRNDPGPLMRRLLGMSTLRVCVGCYDDTFKSHPQQLQKAEATGEPSGDRHLTNLVAAQKARGLRT